MSDPVAIREFGANAREAVASFIDETTAGGVNKRWALELLTSVVTDPKAVCDLFRGDQRVGVGVSVDQWTTEGNAAELSVFPRDPSDHPAIEAMLSWGATRARAVGRERLDIPAWKGTYPQLDLLGAHGFSLGHSMNDMERRLDICPDVQASKLPTNYRWQRCSEELALPYYKTLVASWADLPGSFIGTFAQLLERIETYADPIWLLLTGEQETPVAAFFRVECEPNRRGVIAALGRHPDLRGHGLGEHIMARALGRLSELNAEAITLEVAASNSSGLALYERFGFEVVREMPVYSRPLDPS